MSRSAAEDGSTTPYGHAEDFPGGPYSGEQRRTADGRMVWADWAHSPFARGRAWGDPSITYEDQVAYAQWAGQLGLERNNTGDGISNLMSALTQGLIVGGAGMGLAGAAGFGAGAVGNGASTAIDSFGVDQLSNVGSYYDAINAGTTAASSIPASLPGISAEYLAQAAGPGALTEPAAAAASGALPGGGGTFSEAGSAFDPAYNANSVMNVDYGPGGEGVGFSSGVGGAGAAAGGGAIPDISKLLSGASGGSTLSNLLGTDPNLTSLAGTLGASALGALGANAQEGALGDVQSQYLALGAPSRARLEASYAPGFNMMSEPGYADALKNTTNEFTRAASAGRLPGTGSGNPFGNPSAWAEIQNGVNSKFALPQLNTYRSQNATSGQLGVNTAGTAGMGEAQAGGGLYDALGYGLNALTQPKQNTLQDLLSQYMRMNTGGVA